MKVLAGRPLLVPVLRMLSKLEVSGLSQDLATQCGSRGLRGIAMHDYNWADLAQLATKVPFLVVFPLCSGLCLLFGNPQPLPELPEAIFTFCCAHGS